MTCRRFHSSRCPALPCVALVDDVPTLDREGEAVKTGSSNYTHEYDSAMRLSACSEAVDFMHYYDDGSAPDPTGYGFCPHDVDDTVIGGGVVWIGFP